MAKRCKMGPRRWAKKLGIPMPPTKKQMLLKTIEWYDTHEMGINCDYVLVVNQLIFLEGALKDLAPGVFKKYKAWEAKTKKRIDGKRETEQRNKESKA